MGNDRIKKKFDEINEKIDFMIELCQNLQQENEGLVLKVRVLESDLKTKDDAEKQYSEQDILIQSKIDGLLEKLEYFSSTGPGENSSNR